VDYSQSNVVTCFEYLDILKRNNCKGNQRRKAKGKGKQAIEKSSKPKNYIKSNSSKSC
jgi:hypothetical protein